MTITTLGILGTRAGFISSTRVTLGRVMLWVALRLDLPSIPQATVSRCFLCLCQSDFFVCVCKCGLCAAVAM